MARAPMTAPVIVALDGPAGSGKSSVSMAAARQLAFAYLDTGAAYRAVAWHVLEHDIDAEDPAAVTSSLENLEIIFDASAEHFSVSVGSTNVTDAIRTPEVTALVSAVARVPEVRALLNQRFRETMANAAEAGIVVEGRDITTVVAPDADARILLTADESVRMERRGLEVPPQLRDELTRLVRDRDAADARVSDFMTAADGVVTIDSTNLTFDQTVDAVVAHIRSATA
jgi:cytidylate kinase